MGSVSLWERFSSRKIVEVRERDITLTWNISNEDGDNKDEIPIVRLRQIEKTREYSLMFKLEVSADDL